MSDSATFGGTISGGIQDISALLPLLGTEQCEQHVGSALDRGFLYSSVTPISIFGSLGIVRASFNILVASFNVQRFQFLGARALSNGGFSPVGSVAPLMGMDRKHPKRFLAETRLEAMLAEEDIDNVVDLTVSFGKDVVRWNVKLVFSTLFISLAGLLPYILVILGLGNASPRHFFPLGFGFPILRVFGSAVCVVVVQFLIQIRVITLLKARLLFICINQLVKERGIEDLACEIGIDPQREYANDGWASELAAEQCILTLQKWLATRPRPNLKHYETIFNIYTPQYEKHLKPMDTRTPPSVIFFLCFMLAAGCASTVVGYVGCFFLIQRSASSTGTLVWLGLEAILSVLRIIIWAANPSWDNSEGIVFELQLSDHPPMITTNRNVDEILVNCTNAPLIRQKTFLEDVMPYTGPLRRFDVQDVELYYLLSFTDRNSANDRAAAQDPNFRYLLIVISAHKEQTSRVLVKHSFAGEFNIYTCSLHAVPGSSEINVRVQELTSNNTHFLTRNRAFMAKFTAHYDEVNFKLRANQEHNAFIGRTWAMHENFANQQRLMQQNNWGRQMLTRVDQAYLHYCLLEDHRRNVYRVFEDWIDIQVKLYVPTSLNISPPRAGQNAANHSLKLLIQQHDAIEKAFLQLECRKFFEFYLLSYVVKWDGDVMGQRTKFIRAVQQSILPSSEDSYSPVAPQNHTTRAHQNQLVHNFDKRLESFLRQEAETRRNNTQRRISEHQLGPHKGTPGSTSAQDQRFSESYKTAVTLLLDRVNDSDIPSWRRPPGFRLTTTGGRLGVSFKRAVADRLQQAGLHNRKYHFASSRAENVADVFEERADRLFDILADIDLELSSFLDGPGPSVSTLSITSGSYYVSAFKDMLDHVATRWRYMVKENKAQV